MKKKFIAMAALFTASVSAFTFGACGEDQLNLQPSDQKTTAYVETVLEATQKAPTGVGEFSATASVTCSVTDFDCDENGAALEESETETEEGSITANLNGLWNADGDVDAAAEISLTGETTTQQGVYAYLRGGYALYALSDEEIDLSETTLSAMDISELIASVTGISLPEVSISGEISYSTITTLALRYGAVKLGDNSFELDIDKAIASLVKDFLQTVESIAEGTTLGSIVESNAVKVVVDSLLGDLTSQELYDAVSELIEVAYPGADEYLKTFLPKPAADQSVYEYLVAVINDKNFSKVVLPVLGITASDKTLAQVTLGDLTDAETIAEIKETVSNAVKMDYKNGKLSLTISIGTTTATVSLKDFAVTFTVNPDNSCITAVSVECGELAADVNVISQDYLSDYSESYTCSQTSVSGSLGMSLNLNSEKTLADLTDVETSLGVTVGELLNPTPVE